MVVAYIAHALSAPTPEGIEENRQKAARWSAWACLQGVSPVCSWIVLTGVLEETPANRALGLACDCAQVERCDVVLLVGASVTSGMRIEADHARAHGIPVLDLTGLTEAEAAAKLRRWAASHADATKYVAVEMDGVTWLRTPDDLQDYFRADGAHEDASAERYLKLRNIEWERARTRLRDEAIAAYQRREALGRS